MMAFSVSALVVLGLAINLVSVVLAVIRLLRLDTTRSRSTLVTTLILPLSGQARSLDRLVARLAAQTHRARRLIVAVESEQDPAFARAQAVAATSLLPIEIVVAGIASVQGQKCRNQQAALDRIDDRDEAIVLLDGDIMPTDWWLDTLVAPLADKTTDIVAGLRWQQVQTHRLGSHLTCMIDRAAFLLPRFRARIARVVWGGSVALSARAVRDMQLHDRFGRTISDDLSLVEAAKQFGQRILTRPELLVPTPADQGVLDAWHFACRQYRIVHIYRPWLWRLALGTIGIRLAAWIAVLAGVAGGHLGVWALTAMLVLALAKQALVLSAGRRAGLPDSAAVTIVQLALAVVQPLVDAFNLSAIVAAGWTSRITWGHVTYRIAGPYDIAVIARRAHGALDT